ncbi:juxtaposed with another zinc finger protein 1 [Pararge aegeria]|uniref:Jg23680 protein n=2 Tax=Pararge aegeria aegeria TaxID=348720 RepID=A0A8S4RG41_9NEOP|nr:juxtaposed with another zinc finger protein 1 [Pararge aegeria]CAH2234378.1 jg23680 [Pararge aegeria aegeria]
MAVFMINICKFNGCGITFPRLSDLIEHIEDVHIDYDPAVVEQKEASQPSCIPLSYVLKFFTEASRREIHNMPAAVDVRRRLLSAPKTPSVRSSTPTGSEMDEEDVMSPSDDSNDSWATVEEYSSEFILRYGVKMNANASSGALGPAAQEKPFACPVPGCKKRYKNVNGIKYHSKNGHKKDGKVKKAYKCQCGKSYKTAQGLKSHSITQHTISTAHQVHQASEGRIHASKLQNLVVTASPSSRPHVTPHIVPSLESLEASKLVRIYDTLKAKDLPSFTIPKHNLTHLNIISANQNSQTIRHSVHLNSTPAIPLDKIKYEKPPKVTVTPETTYEVPSLTLSSDRRG